MPETKKRPLEEMNALFSETSWFVPTAEKPAVTSDLEARVVELASEKNGSHQVEQVDD